LTSEISKYNGFLDYEKTYEKENDFEIGFGLKLGLGAELSTKFAGMVRSDLEKGTYSVGKSKHYPTERAPESPNTLCALNELATNVIQPAIDWATRGLINAAEIVGEKTYEVINAGAKAILKISSGNPLTATISYWTGAITGSEAAPKVHLKRPAQLLGIQAESIPTGTIYGVGGFYRLQPEDKILSEPISLTIQYDPADLGYYSEDTLKAFRWNEAAKGWELIGGTIDFKAHSVVFQTSRLGTYTLAPRAPADGRFDLYANPASLSSDGFDDSTITSGTIYNNDGSIVSDGTLFTVESLNAVALGNTQCGNIQIQDANSSLEGIQVPSYGGMITFRVQSPYSPCMAKVAARSVTGGAWGESQIDFADGSVLLQINHVARTTSSNGGMILPSGTISIVDRGAQAFSIVPDRGGRIVDVLIDGVSQGPITSYTFSNVTEDHSIEAVFMPRSSGNRPPPQRSRLASQKAK
jgi:hypothetical protein